MPDGDHLSTAGEARSYLTFEKIEKEAYRAQQSQVAIPIDDEGTDLSSALYKSEDSDLIPALMLVGSSLMYTIMQCLVRYVTKEFHVPVLYVSFYCGLVKAVLSTMTIALGGRSLWAGSASFRQIVLVITRGIFGAIGIVTNYAALQRIPVGVTVCLSSMTPVVTSFLGWFFLSEKLTIQNYVVLSFITLGAVLVGMSDPSTLTDAASSQRVQGVLLCVLTALSIGCVYVIMRNLGSRVHVLWIVFSVSISCMVAPVIIYGAQNGMSASVTFLYGNTFRLDATKHLVLAGIGVTSFIASMCLNYGCRLIRAGKSAVLMMLNIPFGFLIALIFLGEFPTSPLEISGCLVIAMCTYITAIHRSS